MLVPRRPIPKGWLRHRTPIRLVVEPVLAGIFDAPARRTLVAQHEPRADLLTFNRDYSAAENHLLSVGDGPAR